MPKQLLIDGHSLLFRAFHALPPLATRSGTPTGAVYGFFTMLLRAVEDEKPDRVVVAFDAPETTFRHEQYQEYKGTREQAPEDFRVQVPLVQNLLSALGIPVVVVPGYEADDILGTLAIMGQERGYDTYIVTGDRDLLQLVREGVTVLLTSRTGMTDLDRMTPHAVYAKMGVRPEQIPDLKGLEGDASDNIPGVAGIGKKSAVELLRQYGSVDGLITQLDSVTNSRWLRALKGHEEEARRYRDLATIMTKVPVPWPDVDEPYQMAMTPSVATLLDELELSALRRRLEKPEGAAPPVAPAQKVLEPLTVTETVERFEPDHRYVIWQDADGVLWWGDVAAGWVGRWDKTVRDGLKYVAWGTKGLVRRLLEAGAAWWPPFQDDGKLGAYLLDSEKSRFDLVDIAQEKGYPAPKTASEAIAVIDALIAEQAEAIRQGGLERVYREVELPLAPVLAKMETEGVLVDRERLLALGKEVEESLAQNEQEIFRLAGMTFNINSPQQLGEVLFGKLGLPVIKKTKTGVSTDAETLETLAPLHPIVEKVLSYRQMGKIKGTYVDGLLPLIGPDGRIHTTFHQTVAATGRLSSSDPNLQNIPVREPLGRRVRSVFVPSPGRILLAADYSQIELRMLAHLSGDDHLIQAFWAGEDIHRRTAAEIFGIDVHAVDAVWRNRAKAVNFGIVYGISDFGLARDTGVSRAEAKEYIERYFARYPRLKEYFAEVVEAARRDGYVRTIVGRRRPLADIRAANRARRQYAERMAMNTAIQGSAADLIKIAMVRIDRRLEHEGFRSRMILQVHDELIWDAYPEEVERLAQLAAEEMTGAMSLKVPLVVEFKTGANWEAMTPWPPADGG